MRTLLLDRMSDAECAVTERFALPPDFSIDEYFQGQFGVWRGESTQHVVVEFAPRVAEFVRSRRVHASQRLEALPGGGVRLHLDIGDLTELVPWVLGFGETARAVEPAELVERVRAELDGALRAYAPPATNTPPASESAAPPRAKPRRRA